MRKETRTCDRCQAEIVRVQDTMEIVYYSRTLTGTATVHLDFCPACSAAALGPESRLMKVLKDPD